MLIKNVITEPLFKRTSFFTRSHRAVVPFIAALISTNQIITQSVLMYGRIQEFLKEEGEGRLYILSYDAIDSITEFTPPQCPEHMIQITIVAGRH